MTDKRPGPQFFIAGAPKCATDSLYTYLRAHPGIFMPELKEPHYFSTDLPNIREFQEYDEYLALFDSPEAQDKLRGEASVWYLFSRDALPMIRERIPDAKIIIMLRNPIDFVQSMHSQFVYNGIETELDFMSAWRRQDEQSGVFKQYQRLGKFGDQVERALDLFPTAQVHFSFLEDMAADTRGAYLAVLDFLAVEDDGREDFPRENENKIIRNRAVDRFAKHTPRSLALAASVVKRAFGIQQLNLLSRLRTWNSRTTKRRPISSADRHELVEAFRADILKLQDLTGRNLEHWLR